MIIYAEKLNAYLNEAFIRLLKLTGFYKQWANKRQLRYQHSQEDIMMGMYGEFVQPGDLCFDVGANKGSRVSVLLKLGAKVIAIEPQDDCTQLLKKRFANEPVTIIKKGLGAKKETRDFFISDNSSISSFSQDWISNMKQLYTKRRWDKVEQTELTTLDALIAEYGLPRFIKIDTEGFETEVLKGLSTCIPALSFEYTLPFHKHNAMECLDILDNLYKEKGLYNVCRDESYSLDKAGWVSNSAMKTLIESDRFTPDEYGMYGDIYVKLIS